MNAILLLIAAFSVALAADANTHPPEGVGQFLLDAIYVIGILVLILTLLLLWKQVFGRRPPIDEDIRHYNAKLEQLKSDLAKLPDDQKFTKLAEQLAGFATVKQLVSLEAAFDRQFKNLDAYSHSEVHRLNSEVGALELHATERGERLARLEADSRTLTQQLRDLNIKADKIVDRVGDKIEQLIREGVIRGAAR